MKVIQSQFVEFLTDENYWETAICIQVEKDSFKILCLDGQVREFTDADENIKWRL